MFIFIKLFFIFLAIRTCFWHLQNWQIREYRFDRLKSYFRTHDGKKNLFNLYFFKGILPRPKFSGRVFLILVFFLIFSYFEILFLSLKLIYKNFFECWKIETFFCDNLAFFNDLFLILIWERSIFLLIALSVFISKFPVFLVQKFIFLRAKKIIDNSKNIIRIGITGSYGKSSTKKILIHLLVFAFGEKNVLYNPGNQNTEVSIAKLILKNKKFFLEKNKEKKFLIIEVGAYKKGEIKKVCNFFQPNLGIITGINNQHLDLFGSQKNIQEAKFELAEKTQQKVFFNADNVLLSEIFADKKISATKIAIKKSAIKNIKKYQAKTEFFIYGKNFLLPWPGEFFVQNALLALELCRELKISVSDLAKFLKKIPPLSQALTLEKFKKGSLLKDLYSANLNGVLSAIEHLGTFGGKKIFVGIPLLELGKNSETSHKKIFEVLKKINAEVFWFKKDFSDLGKKICQKKFHADDIKILKQMTKNIQEKDAILLESRLPEHVLKIFV